MEDLKKLTKEELVDRLIRCRDLAVSQASRWASAMGTSSEGSEKAEYERRMNEFDLTKLEILRRIP
jgi:hypothetical protein